MSDLSSGFITTELGFTAPAPAIHVPDRRKKGHHLPRRLRPTNVWRECKRYRVRAVRVIG